MDPMNVVSGYAKDSSGGAWKEMSFTHAIEDFKESDRFIIGNTSAFTAGATAFMRFNV